MPSTSSRRSFTYNEDGNFLASNCLDLGSWTGIRNGGPFLWNFTFSINLFTQLFIHQPSFPSNMERTFHLEYIFSPYNTNLVVFKRREERRFEWWMMSWRTPFKEGRKEGTRMMKMTLTFVKGHQVKKVMNGWPAALSNGYSIPCFSLHFHSLQVREERKSNGSNVSIQLFIHSLLLFFKRSPFVTWTTDMSTKWEERKRERHTHFH